jgi:hypothetical protein
MSWADDFLKTQQGATQAQQATGEVGPVAGFVESTLSAIPELFGEKPAEGAVQFRTAHPWAGLGSQLVGGLVPYVGMGALSETATGAKLLDEALQALPGVKKLTAIDNPVLYGAAKEAVRYSPVEIARLGVGLGTTDNWHDYGNLFADVGLSTLITGGFGGIGGLFRVGGKLPTEVGGVEGAPLGLRPTFELRMADTPEAAPAVKDSSLGDVKNSLLQQVYTETPFKSNLPGQGDKYVLGLEGGAPETDALMNVLFKPSRGKANPRLPLMDKAGNWNLSEDQIKTLSGALAEKSDGAVSNLNDLAKIAVYPRLVSVTSPRAAGNVSKALDDSAMQWVSPGVMAGKETSGGLHVMAVRTRAREAPETAPTAAFGGDLTMPPPKLPEPPKIAPGDQWLLFKTDQPQVFAPEGYKLAKTVVNEWSKFRYAYAPSAKDDFASRAIDSMVQNFGPTDVKEAISLPRATAVSNITGRLADKFVDTVGLKGSATLKKMADTFIDRVAPTVVKERKSILYARLLGTLRAAHTAGDELINKMIGGEVKVRGGIWTRGSLEHTEGLLPGRGTVVQAIHDLSDEDLANFARIQNAQQPADELEKLTANGQVSDGLRNAVNLVRDSDRWLWENHFAPALQNAGLEGKYNLLEGYVGPRIFSGDYRVPVKDEYGNLKWLSSGTKSQALHEAKVITEEAEKAGKKLQVGDPYMIGVDKDPDEIKNLHDLVEMQIGKTGDMQDVVERAMRRMAIDQKGRKPTGSLPRTGTPKTLTEARKGTPGSPDIAVPTRQDVIKSIDSHYRQISHFAGTKVWDTRFGQEIQFLSKQEPMLWQDLGRKKNQMMGYEGQITRTLNTTLDSGVLGEMVGSKSATKIALATNELLYDWNLAIMNPTFSILNVLQPLQTVLPHLSFLLSAVKRGLSDEIEKDLTMSLRYGADGKPRDVIGVLSPAKIMGRALKYMGNPPDELKQMLGVLKTRGELGAQLFEGFEGGVARGTQTIGDAYRNAGGGASGSWEAIKRIATFTAERSEEVSRGLAASCYYILGKDYLVLEPDRILQLMSRGTRNSMFGYSLIDRSRIFTGPIGSMFGLFKNWQMHFIASMFQYAGLGWNKGAWGPLLWQFGAAGALGGLGAMGPLKWVADSLASWQDNSPNSYLWMQEHWHDSADEIYFGLPAFFGATLQASSTLPGTDVRNDITSLSNFVVLERAKAAGKAVGAAWDYATVNGQDPLRQPNIRDQLMQAFAPRAFFRAFASVDGDYIKSMATGYPQVRDVSPLSKLLYGAGLNQVQVERQQVASRELWADKQAREGAITQLGVRLADAQLNGDFDTMEQVNMQAMAMGLPLSSVYKGARTRIGREQNQDIMSQYRGELASRYRQAWQQ